MAKRFMVDIESLGAMPGGVILSIGWVQFTLDNGPDPETAKEIKLDIQTQLDAGLKVDGSTLEFWLKQTALPWAEETRTYAPSIGLKEFLTDVRNADQLWAKPPSYDLVGIRHAAELLKIPSGFMWHHRAERCFRTLKSLAPPDLHLPTLEDGVKHGALVDAIHQATECTVMLKSIGEDWQ